MVERYVRDVEVAGSNPVTSTRLSLDAIRVPGSAFSSAFSLALAAGSDLVTSTGGELPLPNRELHLCGVRDFYCLRFRLVSISSPKPTRLSLDASRVPELGFFFCLTARVCSEYLFCHPNPWVAPQTSRESRFVRFEAFFARVLHCRRVHCLRWDSSLAYCQPKG